MKLHLVNKLWKVTGYKINRGCKKERGEEKSISEVGGKGKTKNGCGVELIKCLPFHNNWKWAQLTM